MARKPYYWQSVPAMELCANLSNLPAGISLSADTTNEANAAEVVLEEHQAFMGLRKRPSQFDDVFAAERTRAVQKALSKLPDKQQGAVVAAYGIGLDQAPENVNFEELGRERGVTGEAVRSLHQKALQQLRQPAILKALRDYLE